MLFGFSQLHYLAMCSIVAFAEALYSPLVNVFMFKFTKAGREGTFLTLTAAPTYFTMALTGIIGGYLLQEYYPADSDSTRKKQPVKIWLAIMIISGASFICLYVGRNFFNVKEDAPDKPL